MSASMTEFDYELFGAWYWILIPYKPELLTFLAILGLIEIALMIGG